MPNNKILYKYRSLKDFKFFMDIILNNRLYAAKYNELNDIREGHYMHDGSLKKITIDDIREIKENTRICSVTTNYKSQPMWVHYADNHTGVVIGFRIKDNNVRHEKVKYTGIKKSVNNNLSNIQSLADDILMHKEQDWKYEEEVRILKNEIETDKLAFINIEIIKIIFGQRIAKDDAEFLTKLIEKLNLKIELLNFKDTQNKKSVLSNTSNI